MSQALCAAAASALQDSAAHGVRVPKSLAGRLGEILVRPWVYWLFHSWRLFGYGFLVPPLLLLRPLKTIAALGAYIAVHRQKWWQRAVHRFLGYGASRRHKIINPYSDLIKDEQRYLWSLHPHSILADGWHSIIARNPDSFEPESNGPPEIGRKIALCFAPIVQHVPVHQEMYRKNCGGVSKKDIVKWWRDSSDTDPAMIPGGFAESVFADAGEKRYEYSYLKDRMGFIRICLEEGKDIVPIYTYKSTWMYNNPGWLRGWRARFSQHYYVGIVFLFGKMGTAMPLTDDTTTVVFPPFPVSKYTVSQLEECHADYLVHLKTYFDKHKEQYGMGGVELVFVGKDFEDTDSVANALRRLGVMTRHVKKATSSQAKL
mmetsp:Transcript_1452/g.3313  ORF Transcript_1452/g.3313 Transcript_1452/m.3313 type:complete len:373 (+) Transcript_1452:123-1241(+)